MRASGILFSSLITTATLSSCVMVEVVVVFVIVGVVVVVVIIRFVFRWCGFFPLQSRVDSWCSVADAHSLPLYLNLGGCGSVRL